jgi:hypothetical protein
VKVTIRALADLGLLVTGEGWLPIALCPTDGKWRLIRLPDGKEVIASFDGDSPGSFAKHWRVKSFGYHNPSRKIGVVGGVGQMSEPYDTVIISTLKEGVHPTHFRPNDTVFGAPLPSAPGGER